MVVRASREPACSACEPGTAPLPWPCSRANGLAVAILQAIVYADLFDYPLKAPEIHRFLPGWSATLAEVEGCLAHDRRLGVRLGAAAPFWFLAGRDHLVAVRRQRESSAAALWASARRYAHLIAALPFVKMVAVTGALAVNNPSSAQDDIDLLIVSQKGRVWLVRGQAVLLVRAVRQLGVTLCPNYVLADHVLDFGPPSLFTAHELAQLVPLYGWDLYRRILAINHWVAHYLPNAGAHGEGEPEMGALLRSSKRVLEAALSWRPGDGLEEWEQRRKIPRLTQEAAARGGADALFTPDICKGHMGDHGAKILQRFAEALAAHGLPAGEAPHG